MSAVILCVSIVGGATDSGVLRLAPSTSGRRGDLSVAYQQAGVILKLCFVLLIAIPVLLFGSKLSSLLFQTSRDAIYITTSLVALLATLLMRSAQMQYQITERFAIYGIADLANSVLKFGGIAILLSLAHPAPLTVLAMYGLTTLFVAAMLFFLTGNTVLKAGFSRSLLTELAGHVKWFVLVSATGTLLSRMDLFLVSSMLGVASAGIYSAAQLIALIPQLIGSYIAVVFSPRIMPMWEAGTLAKLYRDVQLGLVCVAILAYMSAFAILPRMSTGLFPPSFLSALPLILLLLPSGLCAFINFPLTLLLLLFIRPRFLVLLDCVSLPLLLAAYAWAIRAHGVIGAATVTTTAAIFKTLIMQIAGWRLLRNQTQTALPAVVSALGH